MARAAVAPEAWRNRIVGAADVPPSDLLANPNNWRTHPGDQRDALRGSLGTVGWVQQVLVNTRTGHMVDGHARVEEALSRNEPTVPVLYVDLAPDEEALVLAVLDPIGALATTDEGRLAALLSEFTVEDDGLARLLAGLAPAGPKPGLTDPDDVPEPAADPYVGGGQLWMLGDHRILCGDSADASSVERLLDGHRPTLIATDPPYGVDYAAIVASRKNQKLAGWADIRGDADGPLAADLTKRVLEVARPLAAEGCAVLVWHPQGTNARLFHDAIVDAGVHVLRQIIWVKPSLVFGRHEYHWRHENALYGWFEGSRARFLGDRSETTVWEVDYGPGAKVRNGPTQAAGLGLHPTQKPVELTTIPIRNHTEPGDVVYEPFAGSGSAIIAAEMAGRRCFAIDLEPRYVQVAIERWQAFTGRKAELVDG